MKLSIIIPVFNSSETLDLLNHEIFKVVSKIDLKNDFELIFINDNSEDDSWKKIKKLKEDFSYIKAINFSENFGQHNAIFAGFSFCSGEKVITLDDDLQHSPKFFPEILETLEKHEVCYTYYKNRKHKFWKKVVSDINNFISSSLLNKPINIYMSSFRGIRKNIIKKIINYKKPDIYLDGIIINSTKNIGMISVDHYARKFGESNYDLKRLLKLWSNMVLNFSFYPIRFGSFFGILLKFLVKILRKKNTRPQFEITEFLK